MGRQLAEMSQTIHFALGESRDLCLPVVRPARTRAPFLTENAMHRGGSSEATRHADDIRLRVEAE
jgi:hypothetical protein